jgi:hypothetical protein
MIITQKLQSLVQGFKQNLFDIFINFLPFPTNFQIQGFELKGGTRILQLGPQKDLDNCNRVPGSPGKKSRDSPAEFRRRWSPMVRENRPGRIRGARANLAGGDVEVGVDRRGWNDDDPRWWRWCSTTTAVFWHAGDQRGVGVWSMSCTEVMWFGWYTCRGQGTTGMADCRELNGGGEEPRRRASVGRSSGGLASG